jgi:hypothetical protein
MKKISLVLGLALTAAVGFVACGDSTRNNQGTSFTFLGWYQPELDEDGNPDPQGEPEAVTGLYYSLDNPAVDFTAYAGIQNNLYGEALRVQRIHYNYEVIGSSIQVPSTEVVINWFLGPSVDNSNGAFDQESTLPDSFQGGDEGEDFSPKGYVEVPMLPAALKNFLSLNRNRLPQTPFSLVVRSSASGVSTAGRQMRSNDFDFEIVVVEQGVNPDSGNEFVEDEAPEEDPDADTGDADTEAASESEVEVID